MAKHFPKLNPERKSWHQPWTLAAKWQQFAQPFKISIGIQWLKAGPSIFRNCTLRENHCTNYGPWLPSGSNLHCHQKPALGLNGLRHGQDFSKLHPWRKSRHQLWTLAAKWQQFALPSKISIGTKWLKAWPSIFRN